MLISDTLTVIDHALELENQNISELNMDARAELHSHAIDIVSGISYRVKEMRISKVQKNHAIEKSLKMAGEQWQKSTYRYAISSVKTQLHRIEMCIDDGLLVNQKLGIIASHRSLSFMWTDLICSFKLYLALYVFPQVAHLCCSLDSLCIFLCLMKFPESVV